MHSTRLEDDIDTALAHYNQQCAHDPQADAAWVEFAGADLDAFQEACLTFARVCRLTPREAALVMFATLEQRWEFEGHGDQIPDPDSTAEIP